MRKITVSSGPHVSTRHALAVIHDATFDAAGRMRAECVGGKIVAEVPTTVPSVVLKRRLGDAGIDAEVDTVVRLVSR